jgi:sec-independent protein translocase protein TatA
MGLENPLHLAFLAILLLLVFGAKRLPEMGRSLGDGMRGFKDAIGGENSHEADDTSDEPAAHQSLIADPKDVTAVAVPVSAGKPVGTQR